MRYFQSWPNSLAPFTDFQTMAALSVPPAESHCSLWGQNGQYGNGLRDRQKSANILGPLPGAVIPEPRWGVWPRERFREHGITYETAAKQKSDLYRDLLPAINSRMVWRSRS